MRRSVSEFVPAPARVLWGPERGVAASASPTALRPDWALLRVVVKPGGFLRDDCADDRAQHRRTPNLVNVLTL